MKTLKQAAEEWMHESDDDNGIPVTSWAWSDVIEAFKGGAEWLLSSSMARVGRATFRKNGRKHWRPQAATAMNKCAHLRSLEQF